MEGTGGDRAPINRWNGEFTVHKSSGGGKRGLGANYFAYLSDADRASLDTDGQAVAVRSFDTGERPRGEGRPPEMRVRCCLSSSDENPVADGQVRLDQTLRNALGIKVEPTVADSADLFELRRPRLRTISERICDESLHRRYLFMRVRKADPSDMEKRMVRIPADSFRLLGISSGEKLLITHPFRDPEDQDSPFEERRCALQAYPVTDAIAARQVTENEWRLYDRYPDPGRLLGVTPDLGAIYLDQSARTALGVRTLEVVRVRRADTDAFMQQIRSFGLATAAGAIAIAGVFNIGKSFFAGMLVLALALVVAAVFSFFNLRASSYGTAD